ncbi:diphthine synthase [Vulcanisaeta distributa]|uniref:Diphthine synthase n=1 Tax=Vulcanisaeta distributa (strain DSM 14429 / JCM 11212 / NBRC 100878 / IC-017) TaxID=572478 RepID=E1QP35_VULDI|nr:diphthine synthase [Vulcanisaeta distributa]ADN51400.1 diphthine synthase [Vulcanisaeta distributa DSM 14429]
MGQEAPTLYIVGLGLSPANITAEALEVIRSVDVVFLEMYTSKGPAEFMDQLRSIRGDLIQVSRRDLEDMNSEIIMRVLEGGRNAALLVIGDPMIATTHAVIAVIAKRRGFNVRVINSVSIVCAVLSQLGLSPYKLGPVATITYPRMGVLSMRAYEVLSDNLIRGLHTILLLDIKDDGSFMSASEAVELLKKMEDNGKLGIISKDLAVVYAARIGWGNQSIKVSTIEDVPNIGETPHTIVIPGLLNPVEQEYLVNVLGADEELIRRHMAFINKMVKRGPLV